MEQGYIDIESLAGGFDLQATIESGQSFLWNRADGRMYETHPSGGTAWYWTTINDDTDPAVLRVRQIDSRLEWESDIDADQALRRRLRLDDDLATILSQLPDDSLIENAIDTYRGLRVVRDPPFGALVSFICSAQMRIARIHGMQQALRETFGTDCTLDDRTYYSYPTPETLADATEAELRELGLGYRAPYVQRTADLVATGELDPTDARNRSYEAAREFLTGFVGVGQKVADCILLFSLDFLEAVPLDTWMQTSIEEYYPACNKDSYDETSRALREAFGGEYAGYTQTYVFHYLRHSDDE